MQAIWFANHYATKQVSQPELCTAYPEQRATTQACTCLMFKTLLHVQVY